MPAAGQTTVDFNNSFFDEMLNSAGVRALTRGAAEKALNIARANAPVDTGAYRDGLSDEESTITIPVKSDYDYTVDMPAWITGEKVKEGYNFTLTENTTGNARKGTVIFKSQKGTKEITFVQFGVNDIAGTYEATYSTFGEGDDWVSETVKIELLQDEENEAVFYADGLSSIRGVVLPLKFDGETYQLSALNGQYLGFIESQKWYLYTIVRSEAG